ncbi:TerB family tellurite resistance protein [Brevundimonas sp.]|uniref:tellurite resistance TerB family protein n=1 Tax=Brevundimonas sp. TaxID=1871086 RepID=UPI0025BC2F0D|nr:TerB family tellurite resistance protein [Brevundimonas sp.]
MVDRSLSAAHFVKARQVLAGSSAWTRAAVLVGSSRKSIRDGDSSLIVGDADAGGDAALIYHITYRDSEGHESIRIITLRRIDPTPSGYKLFCWCHAAEANRQFRVDRIREVFCIATGEVFSDPVTYFAEHPMLNSPKDPEGYALSVCRQEVNLLVILAAADGVVHEDEQERILIHVYDRLSHLELDEGKLRRRLSKIVPDTAAFEAAMWRMGRFRDGDAPALMRTMRKLIDADGHVAPEEIAFAEEISARLKAASASPAG